MKKSILMIFFPFIIAITTRGQNVSYNTNTVPISGNNNSAFGFKALNNTTTGTHNVAIGYSALNSVTEGAFNTAIGFSALRYNTTGSSNTAIGSGALQISTTGNYNTANGWGTLLFNTTGHDNTAIGALALRGNTTGIYNTANGADALRNNSLGSFNVAIGALALRVNISGNNNVALGDSAGYKSLGNGNIFMGKRAGYFETGSNKFYLGNDSNKTIIYGDLATGQLLLGSMQPTGYTFKGTRTLNVFGGIIADSVRVAPSSDWADYVFADNYQLKSLCELETFIKINKHLPNIPSAKEVAVNGIELGDMNAKLLAKVEELTLYLLQQQKEIDELKKLIKKLY